MQPCHYKAALLASARRARTAGRRPSEGLDPREPPLEYERWAPRYAEIARAFGFDLARESASADRLLALLPPPARVDPLPRIAGRLRGRTVVVVGLAPTAGPPPVWTLPASGAAHAIVAADGAASTCLSAGLVPDVIVTDLDGPVPAEVEANAKGALVAVHAHGDNPEALARWVPEFSGPLTGSWAGPPRDGLFDVGGFTDGDRAAYLAAHVGARRLMLWGFDFSSVEERDPVEARRKLSKLDWARRLLGELAELGGVPLDEWRPDGTVRPYDPAPRGHTTQ